MLSTETTDGLYRGPGGQDVVTTPEGDVIVFHAWDGAYVKREMYTLPLRWDGDTPVITPPG